MVKNKEKIADKEATQLSIIEEQKKKEAEKKDGDKKDASTEGDTQEEKDELPAGHSYHGEAFNEGPRQKAYLMGTTGTVDFPITTKSPEAQQFFN